MGSLTSDLARWDHIARTQCAYRSSLVQTKTSRCKHLFTNTSVCEFHGCPIYQRDYVGFQRDGGEILLIKKNLEAKTTLDVWSVDVLPVEKAEALPKVTNALKVMHPSIVSAGLSKFEHLQNIIETVKATEAAADEETSA